MEIAFCLIHRHLGKDKDLAIMNIFFRQQHQFEQANELVLHHASLAHTYTPPILTYHMQCHAHCHRFHAHMHMLPPTHSLTHVCQHTLPYINPPTYVLTHFIPPIPSPSRTHPPPAHIDLQPDVRALVYSCLPNPLQCWNMPPSALQLLPCLHEGRQH